MASIAAVANVFPSTMVASRSCGSASSCATMPPRRWSRSASWRTCHLLSEKSAVSASAKKKLAPANNKTKTAAMIGAGSMRPAWRKTVVKAKSKKIGGYIS
jgi:hypothetical protein